MNYEYTVLSEKAMGSCSRNPTVTEEMGGSLLMS